MSTIDTPVITGQKFNKWCHREAPSCNDRGKIQRAFAFAARKDLTISEGSAFFLHELTNCDGFEFVAFSNARLSNTTHLSNGVILVPCFILNMDGMSLQDPMVQKTTDMEKKGRLVYDGWIPITDWSVSGVRIAIRKIDEALSTFSLKVQAYFEWRPKYEARDMESTYLFTEDHLNDLETLSKKLDSLGNEDRNAFYRSLSWFSQAFRLKEPSAKFLFFILSLESLVSYIEKDAKPDSVFIGLKADVRTTSEKNTERKQCIDSYLAQLNTNPTQAITDAYFKCIETGSTKLLQNHMEKFWTRDSEPYKLLFEKQNNEESLYSLRHKIAHGSHDTLSEIEREMIANRLFDAERVARSYLHSIIEDCFAMSPLKTQMQAEIYMSAGSMVASGGATFAGPTEMAIVYG